MNIDFSEAPDFERWPALPANDRVLVGGHTIWTGPFRSPLIVAQPNRWGVVESTFPPVPCMVEADPEVTAHLPLPDEVTGFVDRQHHSIVAPPRTEAGLRLMQEAARLAKRLTQIRGVEVAASPFARTIPLITPRAVDELIRECAEEGVVGLRPLAGLGGGIAITVRQEHRAEDLERLLSTVRARASR